MIDIIPLNTQDIYRASLIEKISNEDYKNIFNDLIAFYEDPNSPVGNILSNVLANRVEIVSNEFANVVLCNTLDLKIRVNMLKCYFRASKENKLKWNEYCAYLIYDVLNSHAISEFELYDAANNILQDLKLQYTVPTVKTAKDIIPSHKFDCGKAILIELAHPDVIRLVKNELFDWIADSNWPVAQDIIYVLAKRFDSVKDIYAEYLDRGYDANYDIGITNSLLLSYWYCKNKRSWVYLKEKLERISSYPSDKEKSEELNNLANDILDDML